MSNIRESHINLMSKIKAHVEEFESETGMKIYGDIRIIRTGVSSGQQIIFVHSPITTNPDWIEPNEQRTT